MNSFISVGMPGDDCCSCEPIFGDRLFDIEYCDAIVYTDHYDPNCLHDGHLWTGSWPGTVCNQYPIINYPECITGDGTRIVQVCQPIATDDGRCRNTTVREYEFTILSSGTCQEPWYTWDNDYCRAGSGLDAIKICISDNGENEEYPHPNQCCSGITVGPPTEVDPNQAPGALGQGVWFFKCSGVDACKGTCSEALDLDGSQTPVGFCFPYTCCPCQTGGGSKNVAISVTSPSGNFSKDLTIPYDTGSCHTQYGSPGGTFCYSTWIEPGESEPQSNWPLEGEKYGATGLQLCDPKNLPGEATTCSGQRVDLSLCCCDVPGSMGETRGTHDCHVCNYQFTMAFVPLNDYMDVPAHEGIKYCFCPDQYASMFPPEPLVPGDEPGVGGPKRINVPFTLIDGSCQPFFLEYVASGLYWNCDCLLAGDKMEDDPPGTAGDNHVTITVTIT